MLIRKFLIIQLIMLGFYSIVLAQSNSFNILWTPGVEIDLNYYSVFRSTVPFASVKIADVNHPDSSYRDNNIQGGMRYYYRVKTVNNNFIQSDYSEEVSAAIPLISGLADTQEVAANQSITIPLDPVVSDPDNPDNTINWTFSGDNRLSVSIVNRVATITAPDDWIEAEEKITLTATDPIGFFDVVAITFISINLEPKPPVLSDLPSLSIQQGNSTAVGLEPYVFDPDNSISELSWEFSNYSHQTLNLNDDTDILTITAPPNWTGIEYVVVTVKDPDDLSDSDTLVIRVNEMPVTAPQILTMPPINIEEDKSKTLVLNNYVTDADDPKDDLNWKAQDNSDITVNINQNTNEARFTPRENWNGSISLLLYVTDPHQEKDSSMVTISVSPVNDRPEIVMLPPVNLSQQLFAQMLLDNYTSDIDDNIQDLTWTFAGAQNVEVQINNSIATFSVQQNWSGEETIDIFVTDKESAKDTASVNVYRVENQNVVGTVQASFFGSKTNFILSWTTVNETMDYIEYGTDISYGLNTEMDDEFMENHKQILAGLNENTTYHYRIVSQDADGKISYTNDAQFTTEAGDEINVFPIPYRATEDVEGNGIYFTNLPVNSSINVYNVSGEPVYKKDKVSNVFQWQVQNNAGRDISSGLYVYIIKDEKNKKITSGKLIVVR